MFVYLIVYLAAPSYRGHQRKQTLIKAFGNLFMLDAIPDGLKPAAQVR